MLDGAMYWGLRSLPILLSFSLVSFGAALRPEENGPNILHLHERGHVIQLPGFSERYANFTQHVTDSAGAKGERPLTNSLTTSHVDSRALVEISLQQTARASPRDTHYQFGLPILLLLLSGVVFWWLFGASRLRNLHILLALDNVIHFALATSVLPIAYDLMTGWGFGAAMSGWLIGVGNFGQIFGAFHIKFVVDGLQMEHMFARYVVGYTVSVVCIIAFIVAVAPSLKMLNFFGSREAQLAFVLASRFCVGYVEAYRGIISSKVWFWVTPTNEVVRFTLLLACSKTLGLGLGPFLNSAVGWMVGASTVEEEVVSTSVVLTCCFLVLLLSTWFFLPHSTEVLNGMIEARQQQQEQDAGEAVRQQEQDAGEAQPAARSAERLDRLSRQFIWIGGVLFGVERAFAAQGLEAATSLILELEFAWSTRSIGVAISLALLCSIPLTLALIVSQRTYRFSDSIAMVSTSMLSALATPLFIPGFGKLLPLGMRGLQNEEMLVLVGDALIFPSFYIADGYMRGFVFQCCKDGTAFSVENFRLLELLLGAIARGIAPPVVRIMIAYSGRRSYATLQASLAFSAFATCAVVTERMNKPELETEVETDGFRVEPRSLGSFCRRSWDAL